MLHDIGQIALAVSLPGPFTDALRESRQKKRPLHDVEYERIGKYKTAVDQFAGKELSDANREMSDAMLDSLHGQFLADVAAILHDPGLSIL